MSVSSMPSGEVRGGVFTRKATGLVRDVSPRSSVVFAVLTAPFPWVLALAIFWTFAAYPGANYYIAFIIAYVLGLCLAMAIGMLSSIMPRSGGDYVLVGRILHPAIGLISSFWFTANVLVSIAFIIDTIVVAGIAPGLTTIGAIGHHQTMLDWGTTLQSDKGWQYGIGIICLVISATLAGAGWKWALRFQNWGFAIAMVGMALVAVLLLVNSGGTFIDHFNSFARPFTHQADSYHGLIATAHKQGIDTSPGQTFSNTVPIIGAVMGFSVYTWFGVNIAGEVRQARSWQFSIGMGVASLVNLAGVLLFTVLFVHSFGNDFFHAINALNGSEAYPLPSPPFYVLLTSVGANSEIVAWLLSTSFVLLLLLLLWLNILQPVRAFFAYAFDGILPLGLAKIESRTRVPIVALGLTVVFSALLLRWAIYGSSLFPFYTTAVMLAVATMILLTICCIVVPWRRRELYESSPMNVRMAGVPVITIAGVVGLVVALINGWAFLHYPKLGLAHPGDAYRNLGVLAAAALLVYAIASYVRSRQGLSLSKTTAEIPPD
jgi:amino acid transporter